MNCCDWPGDFSQLENILNCGLVWSQDSSKRHNDIWFVRSNCQDILKGSGDAAAICTYRG